MRISDWSSDVCSSDLGIFYRKIQAYSNQQHEYRPKKGIKEELQRSIFPARSAPHSYQEIQGQQHQLVKDIEQEEVQGAKNAHNGGVHQQEQGKIAFKIFLRSEERRGGKECVSTGRYGGAT